MITEHTHASSWRRAAWGLLVIWLGCAALGMSRIDAGLLTSYGADLTQPAWLYIIARSLDDPCRTSLLRRTIGRSPELAAAALFTASTVTELVQRFWPRGPFPGTYDPLDIAAYFTGIAVCYAVERRIRSRPVTSPASRGTAG